MSPLDAERRMYEHTKNPIHAWRALRICTELMRAGTYGCDTLPEWLLDYIDTSTEGVSQVLCNAGDIAHPLMAARLADALGFKRTGQGVRTMAGSNVALRHRQQALARMMWNRKRDQPTRSIESIAVDIEARLDASAAWFEQGKQDGNIPASERPNEHEMRATKTMIEDAWREWHDFLEDEWGNATC